MTELIFSSDESGTLTRRVQRGTLRRLHRGIYTEDLTTSPEELVRRNAWEILGTLIPGAVITDRTARNPRLPLVGGQAFIFCARSGRRRRIDLPGLTIIARPGAPAQLDEVPFHSGLFLASEPRAVLENARRSAASKDLPPSTLSRSELDDWIAYLATVRGDVRLRSIRDRIRELALELVLPEESALVDRLIGAALGTREISTDSPALAAHISQRPYDQVRVELFEMIVDELASQGPHIVPAPVAGDERATLAPFFEAWFSNYIEGTEFTLEEARRVVYEDEIPAGHSPADAHDVRGTFQLVNDDHEMTTRAQSAEEFIELLCSRHNVVMGGRPYKRPGQFKELRNQVGSLVFVEPQLAEGTLIEGWNLASRLDDPFARATFSMFLVAEVHPFDDGNGRIARVTMNSELVGAGQQRIIVPTVARYEYLNALKAASIHGRIDSLTSVLTFAQRWTAQVDWSSFDAATADLVQTNAMADARDAYDRGIRLRLVVPGFGNPAGQGAALATKRKDNGSAIGGNSR